VAVNEVVCLRGGTCAFTIIVLHRGMSVVREVCGGGPE
jgi:hypothetical protein